MKKTVVMLLVLLFAVSFAFSGASSEAPVATEKKTFTVGICNFVDDASLNQICENIQNQLASIAEKRGVEIKIKYDNCNADANVMSQIIANFIADKVDVMVGVATPVAMQMQAATEDNKIPVVFAAVSDPLATGIVASLDAPGANITGTSDFLDTNAVMNLIFALNPDAKKIGLLFDAGQDSSTTAIATAKEYLKAISKKDVAAVFNESVAKIMSIEPGYREPMLRYIINLIIADNSLSIEEMNFIFEIGASAFGYSKKECAIMIAQQIQQSFTPDMMDLY